MMRHSLQRVARLLCKFGTYHQLTAKHRLLNLTPQQPKPGSESQTRNCKKKSQQGQQMKKKGSNSHRKRCFLEHSRFLVGKSSDAAPKHGLLIWGVSHITTHRRVIPTMFPKFFSCARVLPVAFPKSLSCRTSVLRIVSHVLHISKGIFHVFFAHLSQRVVLTKLCTCQSVFPTHWCICYLTLREPQLLGGGGGGVSSGGSEGFDGVICISHLFQEHVSVDTRFRKVKLHQVLRRLT